MLSQVRQKLLTKKVQDRLPTNLKTIDIAGEMVEELIISGADIVKVGIGPGSV